MMEIDLTKLECYVKWFQELGDNEGKNCLEAAKRESEVCLGLDSLLARLLVIFTCSQNGHIRDAKSYLTDAYRLKNECSSDYVEAYEYLLNSLQVLVLKAEGKFVEALNLFRTLEKIDINQFSNKNRALIFAAKGYSATRWQPEILCKSMVKSFESASGLDPDNCTFRFNYAMALGRKRRQRKMELTEQEKFSSLDEELKIMESCLESPLKYTVKVFLIQIKNDKLMEFEYKRRKERNRYQQSILKENIDQLNQEIYITILELDEAFQKDLIEGDQFTIMKRMAMTSRLNSECQPLAADYFKKATALVDNWPQIKYSHIALENGKFLYHIGKMEKARTVLKECWDNTMIHEALLYYILCTKKVQDDYDPLLDIAEGLSSSGLAKKFHLVFLYCLRGDYFHSIGAGLENVVESWMEAVRVDPSGVLMKEVTHLGQWKDKKKEPYNFQQGLESLFSDVITEYLQLRKGCADFEKVFYFLKKAAEYYELVNNIPQAKYFVQKALDVAKEKSPEHMKEFEQKMSELQSRHPDADLANSMNDLHLSQIPPGASSPKAKPI